MVGGKWLSAGKKERTSLFGMAVRCASRCVGFFGFIGW